MALFFNDKSICIMCNKTIKNRQETMAFPPLINNKLDPLYLFSDGVFHAECVRNHPLAKRIIDINNFVLDQGRNKECLVCGNIIISPDEYFTTGFITDNKESKLFVYILK